MTQASVTFEAISETSKPSETISLLRMLYGAEWQVRVAERLAGKKASLSARLVTRHNPCPDLVEQVFVLIEASLKERRLERRCAAQHAEMLLAVFPGGRCALPADEVRSLDIDEKNAPSSMVADSRGGLHREPVPDQHRAIFQFSVPFVQEVA